MNNYTSIADLLEFARSNECLGDMVACMITTVHDESTWDTTIEKFPDHFSVEYLEEIRDSRSEFVDLLIQTSLQVTSDKGFVRLANGVKELDGKRMPELLELLRGRASHEVVEALEAYLKHGTWSQRLRIGTE